MNTHVQCSKQIREWSSSKDMTLFQGQAQAIAVWSHGQVCWAPSLQLYVLLLFCPFQKSSWWAFKRRELSKRKVQLSCSLGSAWLNEEGLNWDNGKEKVGGVILLCILFTAEAQQGCYLEDKCFSPQAVLMVQRICFTESGISHDWNGPECSWPFSLTMIDWSTFQL